MKRIINFLFLLVGLRGYGQQNLILREAKIPHPASIDSAVLNWNNNQPFQRNLSHQETELFYWLNYSRNYPWKFFDSIIVPIAEVYPQLKGKNFESLQQDLKNSLSLPMFSLNDTLIRIAKLHADDIVSHSSPPSHISTTGDTFIDRFKKASMKKCGAENIAFSGGNGDALFVLVLLYLDINVSDLGHRKNLLNPAYVETGLGISYYKNGNIFLVEDFACTQK